MRPTRIASGRLAYTLPTTKKSLRRKTKSKATKNDTAAYQFHAQQNKIKRLPVDIYRKFRKFAMETLFYITYTLDNNMKGFITTLLCLLALALNSKAENRWTLQPNGSIEWKPQQNLPHNDHIEMSGRQVSTVLRYGVQANGSFNLNFGMVWPMLRTKPNNTHASLMRKIDWNPINGILVNKNRMGTEKVESIRLDGTMHVTSTYRDAGLKVERRLFPSADKPAFLTLVTLSNILPDRPLLLEMPEERSVMQTPAEQGVNGAYTIVKKTQGARTLQLKPGESITITASIQAFSNGKGERELSFDGNDELRKRTDLIREWSSNLVLESPDATINSMFAFSKIRASESIYETAGGPMHGPGGESYYAAIWANDQAEYVNPFFPFLGYDYGNASVLNSYKHFARFMNDQWKPIPSSIIAEGTDIWNGAGDRGDAAMIAHGASRYIMARGSKDEARQLWPLVKWCLEFCHRKLNKEGVVASDNDELEGRFPAGKANLCTSTLYYDALLSAASLCKEMGESKKQEKQYLQQAGKLRKNIESYFGADIEGFHTYRYYEGNKLLRSWICMPLIVGLNERTEGTIQALFSSKMWTPDGLLTQEGSKTFWDRSTLYALRGVYIAGHPDKATEFLHFYSNARLLGEHVPYAIEAWPEGDQRHLSAESGLYARIITEGLFGIRPTGLRTFTLTPMPPKSWNNMALRHIRAFENDFDVQVKRNKTNRLDILVTTATGKAKKYSIKEGQSIHVTL